MENIVEMIPCRNVFYKKKKQQKTKRMSGGFVCKVGQKETPESELLQNEKVQLTIFHMWSQETL